ncbi:PAS domain S-box protein [Salipaludibacillus sp. CF4.18]|uniref:PAS domain S-box protein n=1 Tax=Salipaludibacillus sp. CF4.18 TaxID=3373081 RepID=UPI003EE749D8
MELMIGQYNVILVIFSIMIAIIASYSAFDLCLRRVHDTGHFLDKWLLMSALSLGIGVWCMHFTGMLAHEPINQHNLDSLYVWASLVIAILGSYISLKIFIIKNNVIPSSILLSMSLSTMHYIGMGALHENVALSYNWGAISVGVIGIYISLRKISSIKQKNIIPFHKKLMCGVLMGFAVSVIHYLAMPASAMPISEHNINDNTHTFMIDSTMLAIGVGIATLIILLLVLFGSRIVEKMTAQSLKLQTNEQYYQSLYYHNPDIVLTFDLEGKLLSVNKTVNLYGYSEEELLHQSFVSYIVRDQLEKTNQHFDLTKKGEPKIFETAIYSKKGERIELNMTSVPIIINKQIVGVYGILKDITELKNTQEALTEAESKYRHLAEDSLVGIYTIQDKMITYVNRKAVEMIGYRVEEIIGMNVLDIVYPEDRLLVAKKINKRLQGSLSSEPYQYRLIKKDQTIIHMEAHSSKTFFQNEPAINETLIDITARKKAEETIEYLAYHDPLTGLFNRCHFHNYLQTILSEETTKSLAVLFFNLDRFNLINESLGQGVGDRLLQEVSKRLKHCFHDKEILARHGGDEFLVSQLNKNIQEVYVVAERILDSFSEPFHIDQYEIYTTASIGISFYPYDREDAETLIKKANAAMNLVKHRGKNNFQLYRSNQMEHNFEKFEIETDLRKALKKNEFCLYYQPKINLTTGKIVGVEALIRWQHSEKGLIPPGEFIPLAEPECLEIEITESMLMDIKQGFKVLNELKSIGVQISLDDFGTGYSSLLYLKELPITKLKIDQSFVRNCTKDSNDATIVKTIIAMAHELKLDVVAEGVELKDQLVILQRNLCDEAQGFLFSKPLPPKDLVQNFVEIEQIIDQHGIPQELSKQKWLEEAVKIARQELSDTVRQQQGMIFKFIEQNGIFIHTLCDGELLYRMDLIPEQIIGRESSDFLSAHFSEKVNQHYRRAWNGEDNVTYEGEVNGIHYICILRPIRRGGKVVEVIGSCADITERKEVEEALKLSESKYRLITDNMLDLVGVCTLDGTVKYASPSHEVLLGKSPKEYEGKSIFDLVHPEDCLYMKESFYQMISTKRPIQTEFRCEHVNGEWVQLEVQGTPVFDGGDEIEDFVFVGRDITERKKIDEYIRKTEKLSAVGQLAAGVAHEIRNPLTSIKGFLQIMQKELDQPNYTTIMLSEIDQLEEIVSEFLSLAKPQASKMTLTDIYDLLEHIVTLISTQAIMNNIEIIQETDAELPFLTCDNHQIKQVFINILQNGLEAMSSGGVIKIQTNWYGSDKIIFRFIDQGCGISDDRIKNIGEPFYSTKEKGTGLGLMISHKIIQEHGGTFNIESTVDKGTTVEVILPIKQS